MCVTGKAFRKRDNEAETNRDSKTLQHRCNSAVISKEIPSLICWGWESLLEWSGRQAVFTKYLQCCRQLSPSQEGIMWEQGTLIKIRGTEQKKYRKYTEKKLTLKHTCNRVHCCLSAVQWQKQLEVWRGVVWRGLRVGERWSLNTKTHLHWVEKKLNKDVQELEPWGNQAPGRPYHP